MRCPKCGYISFDHNQICPKCNKDISDEQAKLNLPTYKSNPPQLLGMLVGAGDESNVGFTLDSDAALRGTGVGLDFEETSSMMESDGLSFGEDDQDLEISLTDDTGEFELPEIDLDDQAGDVTDIDLGGDDEELSLDMDEVSLEGGAETADDLNLDLGEVSLEEGSITDSMDGISPNDSLVLDGVPDNELDESAEETTVIGSFSEEGADTENEGHSTVELNVSDLKINETGELEINSIPDEIYSPKKLPEEEEINIDFDSEDGLELDTDSDDLKDDKSETGSLELSDLVIDETGGQEESGNEDIMTSETMDLDDTSGAEDGLDLGDLAIEDGSDGDEGFDLSDLNLDNNETGELSLSDFEENTSDDSKSAGSEETLGFDDGLTIDLENLDLDLEFDDSDDKK